MTKTPTSSSDSLDRTAAYAQAVIDGIIVAGPHVRNACRRHFDDLVRGPDRGLYFDATEADRVFRFFEEKLHLNGGQFEGIPFILEPSQCFIVGSIFGWKRADGTRRYRRAYIEIGKGNGKALALDTPIPTPNGWSTMGELVVGDALFGADGQVCRVVLAHPTSSDRDCYRVAFNTGSPIVASAEHLWRIERRIFGMALDGATVGLARPSALRTTAELAKLARFANGPLQSLNYNIVLYGPLAAPAVELSIDPYVASRKIVSCERVATVPVRCITVDAPDGMFLAGTAMVPTHNSPIAAGIGLYGLIGDRESGAEVYPLGAQRDQAMVLFRDVISMVRQSPELKQRLVAAGGEGHEYNLAYLKNSSFMRPLSREAGKTGSGPRPHMALADEIHEYPNRNAIEMLERGFKWRRQPLLLMTTNSGSDRKSICWEEHQHAVRCAAGNPHAKDSDALYLGEVIDDTTLAYVCGLDVDDKPLIDPSCWIKANPLLGVILTEEYLAMTAKQALDMPGKANGILRLNFCVWTDAETAWLTRATLESVMEDFDETEFEAIAGVGLDLSSTKDLTAAGFIARDGFTADGKQKYAGWIKAWTPADTVDERSRADNAPYNLWVEDRFLLTTPGSRVNYEFVAKDIADVNAEQPIEVLAYDRYAFDKFSDAMDEVGLHLREVSHPQAGRKRAKAEEPGELGLWMPGSLNTLEELILDRRIRLQRNPVLISAMMSAAIESDVLENRWFAKRRATQRIDPAVALTMAVGAATMTEVAAPVYEILFV